MNERQRMVQRQKKQFHLPNMNTIRRSGSIFLTPFPISTTTLGFSTTVFRRLKSNLVPSFSSFSLGVLVPQPIVEVKSRSRYEWLNYRCQNSTYKSNIHCPTNDEHKQTSNDVPASRPTRTYAPCEVSMGTFSRQIICSYSRDQRRLKNIPHCKFRFCYGHLIALFTQYSTIPYIRHNTSFVLSRI